MIRTNQNRLTGTPARRIAVIQMARPQRARLGGIRPAPPPPTAWTTIQDQTPDSSANWLSYVLMQQARARETTPGSLVYTPASDHPAPNVAPWNSWRSPNCPEPVAADPGETPRDFTKLFLLFGLVTATAAATYLLNSTDNRR